MKKNLICDHFGHISTPKSTSPVNLSWIGWFFSGRSWTVYATSCGGNFRFSVSYNCSAPSKNGNLDTGWIFKVLYISTTINPRDPKFGRFIEDNVCSNIVLYHVDQFGTRDLVELIQWILNVNIENLLNYGNLGIQLDVQISIILLLCLYALSLYFFLYALSVSRNGRYCTD